MGEPKPMEESKPMEELLESSSSAYDSSSSMELASEVVTETIEESSSSSLEETVTPLIRAIRTESTKPIEWDALETDLANCYLCTKKHIVRAQILHEAVGLVTVPETQKSVHQSVHFRCMQILAHKSVTPCSLAYCTSSSGQSDT